MIFYIFKCNFLVIFYSLKYKLPLAQKDCASRLYFCNRKTTNQNKPNMKNTKTIFTHISIICTIVMTVALLCAGMVDAIEVRFAISGIAVLLVGGLYALRAAMQKHDFSDLAMAQLKKAGFACKRKEDGIVVKQGDLVMKAKLWNNGSHGLKRVHFMLEFAPNIINDVLPEGWAVLAAECNANYDHTMMKFYGDHFCCMVETSVKSAKDFLEEYRFAFDKINETMQGMQANADRVASQFPIKKKRVGFVVDAQ